MWGEVGDCLEKEDGLTFEEKLSRGERDEGEWHDEESLGQSQDAAGPFIHPGNRRFRRTAEVWEKLAKVKATAIERVLDELEVEAEKKQMVMVREELVERVSRVYGEELRRADVADPNKARYIRDRMVTGVEESLEEKGWRVLESGGSRSSASQPCRVRPFVSGESLVRDATTADAKLAPSQLLTRVIELEEEVSVGKALIRRLMSRIGQLEETLGAILAARVDSMDGRGERVQTQQGNGEEHYAGKSARGEDHQGQ